MKQQQVIIINSRGGAGKDTMIDYASKYFRIKNVSSVDKIKQIAKHCGWDGEKDERGRQLLIDIKQSVMKYNDLPFKLMCDEIKKFKRSKNEFLFIHIREEPEINKLKSAFPDVKSLLVTRKGLQQWDNNIDDNVETFQHDYTFANDGTIEEGGESFVSLIDAIRSNH